MGAAERGWHSNTRVIHPRGGLIPGKVGHHPICVQNNSATMTVLQHEAWPSIGGRAGTEGIALPTSLGLDVGVFVMHHTSGTDQYVPLALPSAPSATAYQQREPSFTGPEGHCCPPHYPPFCPVPYSMLKTPLFLHAVHRLQTNTYSSPPNAPFSSLCHVWN